MIEAGKVVGGYALLRRLASGRGGEVWLGERHVGGHQAAIKLMRWPVSRRPASETGAEQQWSARLEAVLGLQHPSAARVLGAGREAELAYVATEYIDGVDLELILESSRAGASWPSLPLALHVVRHVAAAVAELHRAGLVHGHLDPSQVLVASNGEVKLIGLLRAPALHEELETLGHDSTHRAVGYLSPEHAHDLEAKDKRSDVFSLGVLLCELATHAAPFRRSTDLETLAAIMEARPPELPAGLDESMRRIILRAVSRRPGDRFADAGEFLAAVDVVEAPPVDESELEQMTKRRRGEGTAAPWEAGEPIEDTLASSRADTSPQDEAKKGRFEILERIGAGGMGEVYRARDRELDEVVALKVIAREVAADEQLLERMRREVRLARRISSERVCRIHDLVELEDGARGISMQFVKGETLASLIKAGVPVDYARFAAWGSDISEGLATAHALSVVHRDLKPENVMIDSRDRAVILDFGIAASSDPASADKLTKQGVILGTLPYMAPEQLTAAPIDGRADIYALGLILGELITGEVPLSAPDYAGLLDRRVVRPARYDLRSIDPATPKNLSEAVNRMLMADPSDRPGDAAELARVLRGVAHEAETGPERSSALEHPTPLPEPQTESGHPSSTRILPSESPTSEAERESDEALTEPPRSPVWTVLALGVAVVLLGVGLVVLGQVLERNLGGGDDKEPAERVENAAPQEAIPDASSTPEPPAPDATPAPAEKARKKSKDWLLPIEKM